MITTSLMILSFISAYYANTCNFDVKLSQKLHNQGFHRNLTYNVMFYNENRDRHIYEECFIGIDQTLPPGVYAYPDELADLKRLNKLIAIPKNRVNVELPAELSHPTSVYIIGKFENGKANLWLPVHARYHKAVTGGGSFHNEIDHPRVYLRCPHINLEQCTPKTPLVTFLCTGAGKDTCIWKEIPFTLMSKPIVMSVPVGDLEHVPFVAPLTVAVVVISSLYLLNTLHEYKKALRKKGAKS